ncbi:DEAD/DEAH box helicase [Pandoraea pnomenusa]|uniref:DEAD/DEAH box helicase n=1 Tax=Pandoraea pnomenusa TaxID=93220 RepID=UPI001146F7A6|nr:DEAD/DEAH box helicase [Pandoraea pnomenusa]QDH58330.1 helicase [Pandoraea pnomenusa]
MSREWGGLRPEQVSQYINFEQGNAEWIYQPNEKSMSSRQAEGVAHLWNGLSRDRVALLADEVGTGKTFQALGVITLLWRMAPKAKVLVMAPNRDICQHWENELAAFVKHHYREADGRVKHGDEAIPAAAAFYGLHQLTEAIEKRSEQTQPTQLYITSIRSLSGLLTGDEQINKGAAAKRVAKDCHRRIKAALGPGGFDLVIVDEAHYFRNTHGGSQRVAAAGAFFGGPGDRLAKRALLLTATPSHTHLDDVSNILGFFLKTHDELRNCSPEQLMRAHALRRFRIMAGTSFTKHQYRAERAMPCNFADQHGAEVFFALYQRRLVHELGATEEKRRMLYGFLEGFESAGSDHKSNAFHQDAKLASEDFHGDDFHKASDTDLLRKLSQEFRLHHADAPAHPKYGRLVDECVPRQLFDAPARALHEDKHLVFVRRIPSVRELTQRLNERYDRLLARHICDAWGASDKAFDLWEQQRWSREGLEAIIADAQHEPLEDPSGDVFDAASNDSDADENDSTEEQRDMTHASLGSRIAALFVTRNANRKESESRQNQETQRATHASLFSRKLRNSASLYAMFLEPSADYLTARYEYFYEYPQGGKLRADYGKAALAYRLGRYRQLKDRFKGELKDPAPTDASMKRYEAGPIATVWSLVVPLLPQPTYDILARWATQRPDVAENFSHYLKAGLLFASPVMVELYAWQVQCERSFGSVNSSVQHRYDAFFNHARDRIADSLLLRYFIAALTSFEQLCEKIVGRAPGDWSHGWRTLTTLSSPAAYASGESSHRQHLIMGFNSPFYPNTLVTTSVFQEGVNLHLNCRKVHHYGIAWTPGDNEQRVGRVDRLFGKVNDLLKKNAPGSVTLDIHYPYLEGSFDEDQVGSFIERKHAIEDKMDLCTQASFDKEIRLVRSDWKEFLRQPVAEQIPQDPYPARFDDDDVPKRAYGASD